MSDKEILKLLDERDRLKAENDAMRELLEKANDVRGFSWHIQRRRENDKMEWLASDAGTVLGPFNTPLEAFAALKTGD